MQKMMIKDEKEWFDGYEFLAFSLSSEMIDGFVHQYPIVICKDAEGYLEEHPLHKVRFV